MGKAKQFVCCATCSEKEGAFDLCFGCRENRSAIYQLRAERSALQTRIERLERHRDILIDWMEALRAEP